MEDKLKLRFTVVCEIETLREYYPNAIRNDNMKICEFERVHADLSSLIDTIVSQKVEVINE